MIQLGESTSQMAREWLTAIGTVFAVLVAVYVGVIRDLRRRPQLDLTFDENGQDRVVVEEGSKTPPYTAYVRLSVVTKKGRTAAEGVEVMVVSVRQRLARPQGPALSDDRTLEVPGQLLVWSNTRRAVSLTIPPGAHRYIDLLLVQADSAKEGELPAHILAADLRPPVKAGSFELELAVSALNADVRMFLVKVSYDGKWGPGKDDIWNHLTIESPRPL